MFKAHSNNSCIMCWDSSVFQGFSNDHFLLLHLATELHINLILFLLYKIVCIYCKFFESTFRTAAKVMSKLDSNLLTDTAVQLTSKTVMKEKVRKKCCIDYKEKVCTSPLLNNGIINHRKTHKLRKALIIWVWCSNLYSCI